MNAKIFILTGCLLISVFQPLFASRNISCVSEITAKVLSCKEYTQERAVSPKEKQQFRLIDLEIELVSVDPVHPCGYKAGQKINLTICRDNSSVYNRIKNDVVIKEGTILKGGIDYIVDEHGSSYAFENISEVINK